MIDAIDSKSTSIVASSIIVILCCYSSFCSCVMISLFCCHFVLVPIHCLCRRSARLPVRLRRSFRHRDALRVRSRGHPQRPIVAALARRIRRRRRRAVGARTVRHADAAECDERVHRDGRHGDIGENSSGTGIVRDTKVIVCMIRQFIN